MSRGVRVVRVMVEDDRVTVIRGGSNSFPGSICRKRVPSGWICWPERVGVKASYFVPDRKHEWDPTLLEAGAPGRISAGDTTWRVEAAAMVLLEKLEPYQRTPEAFARLLEEAKREESAGGRAKQRVEEAR